MIRLRVLGGFALEGPSGAAPLPRPQRRGDAVLAVLAVCGDLGCTRDRLLALLWPESDEARASQGLRDALYAIRRALGPDAVLSVGRLLRLDPTGVACDVVTFMQALASGRLAEAARGYAGPLLDGFHLDDAPEFERWLDGERTRLAREYAEALEQLAAAAERAGAWHEAVGWWGRAVEHDPVNSHFVLQQVRAMAAIGDRANALKVADGHARRLREEFDLELDGEVLAGIELIRRGQTPTPHRNVLPRTTAAPAERTPVAETSVERLAPAAAPGSGDSTPVRRTTTPGRARRWVPWAATVAAAVVVGGAFGVGRWLRAPTTEVRRPRTTIAVLPFRNLSADPSHAYFAGGLHDELLNQLARVASLTVVGRTSVGGYLETSKPPRQISEELGAGSIVEGSVQVVGNRLRVIVQLLDPISEAPLWSENYDRTLDSAFTVQSDIARRIVMAVGAKLTSAEAGTIGSAPPPSFQAYDFYLQGLEYSRRPGLLRENLESAQQLYKRALALDSSFAPAHAALSYVDWGMNRLGYDRSAANLERARHEADVALRLAPNLPEAHLAKGLTRYVVLGDYRGALNEFAVGLRGAPNDAELWGWIGRAHRDLGHWDSALVALDRARRLDPRNANLYQAIGDTYHRIHRYREAIAAYRRERSLAPDVVQARLSMAWSYVLWKGELDTLRAVLRGLPLDADPGLGGEALGTGRLDLALMERRPDSVLALLRLIPWTVGTSAEATLSRTLWAAQAYLLRSDTAAARAADDTAAALLGVQERAHPDDVNLHNMHGRILAGLGRRAEALREARWIARSEAYRRNPDVAAERAQILARLGETDAALADLERALAGPSVVSASLLRLQPYWDPIRNDPRFQALLVKYANPEAGTTGL